MSDDSYGPRSTRRGFVRGAVGAAGAVALGGGLTGKAAAGSPAAPSGVAAAKRLVAAAKQPMKFLDPGPPVDVSKFKGRSVWFIALDLNIPFYGQIVSGLKKPADAAGVKVTIFNGKGQPTELARGVEQAIGAGADGIIVTTNPEQMQNAVRHAVDKHVTLIGLGTASPPARPVRPELSGDVSIDLRETARLLAAYAVANTKGPIHVRWQTIVELPTLNAFAVGLQSALGDFCKGMDCSAGSDDQQLATFLAQTTPKTLATLRAHPETNWLFGFDAQTILMAPAVRQGGQLGKVRIASFNAEKANLDLVVRGKGAAGIVADVGNPNDYFAWSALDRMFRAWEANDNLQGSAHLDPKKNLYFLPQRIFDAQNLKRLNTGDVRSLYAGTDWQGKFSKLWGL